MRLSERNYYFSIESNFAVEDTDFTIRVVRDLSAVLRSWGATTRISPVWPLYVSPGKKLRFSSLSRRKIDEIFFLNALDPSLLYENIDIRTLQDLEDGQIWLTLGVHNVVIFSHDTSISADIREFCSHRKISHESWIVRESTRNSFNTNDIRYFMPAEYQVSSIKTASETDTAAKVYKYPKLPADDTLSFTMIELYALLAVIEGRSTNNFWQFGDDCMKIEDLVSKIMKRTDVSDIQRRDLLLSLNAGLSRLSSQALSGTTPITRTECHFWPHSLMGIGIANFALRNVTEFISSCVRRSHYHERFDLILDKAFTYNENDLNNPHAGDWPKYFNLTPERITAASGHKLIGSEHIFAASGDLYAAPTPVTYYSGRDGFRNEALTTSAPLMSVSGCNSVQWNLGTITHELSHRIISGKLEELFERGLNGMAGPNVVTLTDYFSIAPTTLGELAERQLLMTLAIRCAHEFADVNAWEAAMSRPHTLMNDAKASYSEEIEEVAVHLFDYYHFYGLNAETYVSFIWLSWAVQPAIRQRLNHYVNRTVTALAINYYHLVNWQERAIGEFESLINSEPLRSSLSFFGEVNSMLSDTDSRRKIEIYLEEMQHLIAMFHFIFKSDDLLQFAVAEPYRTPTTSSVALPSGMTQTLRLNYSAKKLLFVGDDPKQARPSFGNPLLFLRDFCRDLEPNAARSAWLLHMLSFNLVDEASP